VQPQCFLSRTFISVPFSTQFSGDHRRCPPTREPLFDYSLAAGVFVEQRSCCAPSSAGRICVEVLPFPRDPRNHRPGCDPLVSRCRFLPTAAWYCVSSAQRSSCRLRLMRHTSHTNRCQHDDSPHYHHESLHPRVRHHSSNSRKIFVRSHQLFRVGFFISMLLRNAHRPDVHSTVHCDNHNLVRRPKPRS